MIRNDRLRVVYQPLRRLSDRGLVGFEALVRWTTASGDDVPPDVFVRLAEASGLGRSLARQVVRKAFTEMAPVLRTDAGLYLGINLTAEDLLDAQFHEYLDEQAAHHGIAATSVVLEITERSTAMRDDLVNATSAICARRGTGSVSTTSAPGIPAWTTSRRCRWMRSRSTSLSLIHI